MDMPRKSKVELSPNYNQIMDWIGEGKSSRWISRELENQFNEKIGHVAISNFRNKNIRSEAIEIVDVQLKEEEKEEQEREKKKNEVNQKIVNRQKERKKQLTGLAGESAKQLRGAINVASHFEEDYKALKKASKKDPKLLKDVTDMSFKALKLVQDATKKDTSIEDSITTGFEELSDAIQKSREILKQ